MEDSWGDTHVRFTVGAADRLNESLPRELIAHIDERMFEDEPDLDVCQRFVEIKPIRNDGDVITVLAFVHAAVKWSVTGLRAYQVWQRQFMESAHAFVEVELARGGDLVTIAARRSAGRLPRIAPYHASIWRASRPELVEYYAIPLRDPLPVLPVPLGADQHVALDLQPIIDAAYQRGRYAVVLDYSKPPQNPLGVDDAAWAAARVRQWKRSSDAD